MKKRAYNSKITKKVSIPYSRTKIHKQIQEAVRLLNKIMTKHEFDRIKQFETEADGDEEKFRQKVLLRAARSSNEKKKLFAAALKAKGYDSLATFIDGIMVDH